MSRYRIHKATSKDSAELIELASEPMKGMIELSFGRAPDFFIGAHVQCELPEVYLCRDIKSNDQLVAMFSVGLRRVYIEGRPERVRYFSDLRLHPAYRNTLVLVRCIEFVHQNRLIGNAFPAHTMVFADNATMEGLVRKTKHSPFSSKVPRYHNVGSYLTHSLAKSTSLDGSHLPNFKVRRAEATDLPEMQTFFNANAPLKLFYPVYEFSRLSEPYYQGLRVEDFFLAFEGERLIGMLAMWDQRSYKQIAVTGYGQPLRSMRRLVNLFSGFSLPKAGRELSSVSVASIAIEDNNPSVFRSLLSVAIKSLSHRFDVFMIGLDQKDPLNHALKHIKSKRITKGSFYLVTTGDKSAQISDSPYYIELARI